MIIPSVNVVWELNNPSRRLLDELNWNCGRPDVKSGNFKTKGECSLDGWCNSKKDIYQACISPMEYDNDGERVYMGISAGNWKQRLCNHPFSKPQFKTHTVLSKYFWYLKDQGLTLHIKWKIVRQSSTANSFNGRYNLCIDEKISVIDFKDQRLLLNEHKKLVLKFRHKRKLSWQRAKQIPTISNSRDIHAGRFFIGNNNIYISNYYYYMTGGFMKRRRFLEI